MLKLTIMRTLLLAIMFLSILIFSIDKAFGQDQMILKNAEEKNVKVLEVGTNEISYKPEDNLDGPVYKISKNEVFLIIFENGTTWKPELKEGEATTETGFAKQRRMKKSLFLVKDTTHHHIVSFHLGAPDLNIDKNLHLFLLAGLSYEWQPKGNIFGIRVMPYYTIAVASLSIVGKNKGKVGLSLSPRFYLKNWKSSQFYVGLEGVYGSYLVDDSNRNDRPWAGHAGSFNFLFGGQVTQKSNFNLNIEVGLGYEATLYTHDERIAWPAVYQTRTDKLEQFVVFVRFGLGGRIRSKNK